ncbi:MAG: metal-sensing transcriptional repressor [Acholeplasmataceae bacterium]|jgi:DNA-binding FrmR family transcriptional regulator|nr:metal-sensing transcriptional repressor [Acholeplasmataceae bacterium]
MQRSCCEIKTKIRTDEDKKNIYARLNKLEGQIRGIKKMIEEDRYCNDILIQLSAINSASKSIANLILENHMKTCVVENIQAGNTDVLSEILQLFKRFQ